MVYFLFSFNFLTTSWASQGRRNQSCPERREPAKGRKICKRQQRVMQRGFEEIGKFPRTLRGRGLERKASNKSQTRWRVKQEEQHKRSQGRMKAEQGGGQCKASRAISEKEQSHAAITTV